MRSLRLPRELLVPLGFVLPSLVYVAYFSFYPTFDAVYLSFQTPFESNTLTNYRLLEYVNVNGSIENTILFTLGALAIQFGLGLAMALLLAQPFRGKGLASTVFVLPIGIATVVAGVVFSFIFPSGGGGYANSALHGLGLPVVDWYQNSTTVLVMIMIADSWKNTPLVMLILLAGVVTIPPSLYEAAAVDGAGALRRFVYVTLPNLKTFVVIALIIRGISEFNVFTLFLILGTDATQVLNTLVFELYSTTPTVYQSLAAASILLGFILVFIVLVVALGGAPAGRRRP